MRLPAKYLLLLVAVLLLSCGGNKRAAPDKLPDDTARRVKFASPVKSIHVFVALCDNKYQGIVPVPEKIGNGDDAANNLYWGGMYGLKTWFNKSDEWQQVKKYTIDSVCLERLVYKHSYKPYYLIADAYRGREIRQCTIDFFNSCSGADKDTLRVKKTVIGTYGNSALLAYIGHDGLMDFTLSEDFISTDNVTRDAIILACISKKYFAPDLAAAGARPLVWTTGLMCPEAYTLHDALSAYIKGEGTATIRTRAVKAYDKYQHCGEKFAAGLLVSGF